MTNLGGYPKDRLGNMLGPDEWDSDNLPSEEQVRRSHSDEKILPDNQLPPLSCRRNDLTTSATASGNSSWTASLPFYSSTDRTCGTDARVSISALDLRGVAAP